MQQANIQKSLLELKAYHELALEKINRMLDQSPKTEKVTNKMIAAALAKRKSHLIKK